MKATYRSSLVRSAAVTLAFVLAGCGIASAPLATQRQQAKLSALAGAEDRAVVTLQFRDRDQLDQLAREGVDLFENVDHDKRTVGATVDRRTRLVLQRLGVKYRIQQNSVVRGFPQGYGSVDTVHQELRAIGQSFPNLVEVVDLGKSIEGRPILAAKITAKRGEKLPAVRITGGTHARELVPVELMRNLTKTLVEGYGKDANITRLLDTRETWIVPVVNPDGRTRVEQGNSMWRKNTRPTGVGAGGVDINRNADDHWDQGNGSKWADDYHGDAPFSEPETQALRDLALKVRFKASFDVHCYGGMVLWPPGYSRELSPDEARFRTIGEKIAKPMGYKAGTIARTIYRTFGDFSTWEYAKLGTLAFAAELDDREFGPGYGQVEKDWKQWRDHFLYFIDAAGDTRAIHPAEGRLLGFSRF
ncbi:MAG: M14 family metallopeptidase [Candidatus Sericytochromatia bacterium]|nr:M14 family metallopeptidase [Candidatus Sericytochromatia bacterium]